MENLALGLSVAFLPQNLLACFAGVFLGTAIGIIPGIGALAAISLLMPLTFAMEPTTGIVMLAGVYYGAEYGGSTSSILLNLPGTPSNAITCLDGHPLAKKGRAGVALFMTTIASFVGGSIGILVLSGLTPLIVDVGMAFGPVGGGYLFDTFGDYHWLYIASAAIGLAAAMLALAFPPKTEDTAPRDAVPA